MILLPPISTRTDTRFPYTTLFRATDEAADRAAHPATQGGRTAGDADRLYGAPGATARSALRHAAGRRFAGAGDLRPAAHGRRDDGDDGAARRGGGARYLSFRVVRRIPVRPPLIHPTTAFSLFLASSLCHPPRRGDVS